jgi:cellulose biosynthesis protein BcsQ
MADRILIPVLPDMHSALTLQSIDGILRDQFGARGKIHYILNRFDVTRRAHREMRERLQKILGNALAPFSIREDPRIQDAMQAGLPVVDYAPHAEVNGDLKTCGDWIEEMLPSAIAVKGMTA